MSELLIQLGTVGTEVTLRVHLFPVGTVSV